MERRLGAATEERLGVAMEQQSDVVMEGESLMEQQLKAAMEQRWKRLGPNLGAASALGAAWLLGHTYMCLGEPRSRACQSRCLW